MPRSITSFDLTSIALDAAGELPLYLQLTQALRDAIIEGHLPGGARLPSSRSLSAQLGVARVTVLSAYEQLAAEGYLEGRAGSGTTVRAMRPDQHLPIRADRQPLGQRASPQLSAYGRALIANPLALPIDAGPPSAFRPNLPDLAAFPLAIWGRLLSRRMRHGSIELLSYADPAGYAPLRAAIAEYLSMFRGVRCTAEQVMITAGSQQAIDLICRLLLNPGDAVWMEEPGYADVQALFAASGIRVESIPVDGDGIQVHEGERRCASARLAYVTPAHQMPLGVTMSPARRCALLDWAERSRSWILEDDYDGEYRYSGRPVAALQNLDGAGRVLYAGTFSKTMFPALRIGYLVLPTELIAVFRHAKTLADRQAPTIEQAAMADFIREGHLARHIRQMRQRYAHRSQVLAQAIQAHCAPLLRVDAATAGLHLIAWLPEWADDRRVVRALAEHAIEARAVSDYALVRPTPPGLVLGFAAFDDAQIRSGVGRMATILRQALAPGARGGAP